MFVLEPTQPYSFALSLKRLVDMPRQVISRVEPGPSFVRTLRQGGRLGFIRVQEEGGHLAVTIRGGLDSAATLARIRQAFSLDLDLAGFQRQVEASDPVMSALVCRYHGARPIGAFDLWESLSWSIIGQQVHTAYAYAMKASLVRLGAQEYEGYPVFPGPESVAAMRYEDLQAERFSRKKAEYIIDIARAIAEGRLDLKALIALPFEEAVRELIKWRGVGRWTAECLLMDAGAPDAFPADDLGIRTAVQRFYGLTDRPDGAAVRKIGRAWAGYTSLACFYLWLALRAES